VVTNNKTLENDATLKNNNRDDNDNDDAHNESSCSHDFGKVRVHVCLCGTQPQTWNVIKAAKKHGLHCMQQESTSVPIQKWLFPFIKQNMEYSVGSDCDRPYVGSVGSDRSFGSDCDYDKSKHKCSNCEKKKSNNSDIIVEPAQVQSHYRAPRRYRNGKLGSKHFLGKYGYRHRRTGGELYTGNDVDMMVEQSINFVFQIDYDEKRTKENQGKHNGDDEKEKEESDMYTRHKSKDYPCPICGVHYTTQQELDVHFESPALPDIMKTTAAMEDENHVNSGQKKQKDVPAAATLTTRTTNNEESIHKKAKYNNTNREQQQYLAEQKCTKNNSFALSQVKKIHDHSSIIIDCIVPSHYCGKRLRWCCRQSDMDISKFISSKKHCETLITSGRICINHEFAFDSSRVLKTGDVIFLVNNNTQFLADKQGGMKVKPVTTNNDNHGVTIIKKIGTNNLSIQIVIARKPVGIRTVGTFSTQTLEMIVTKLMSNRSRDIAPGTRDDDTDDVGRYVCTSLTKLETGCSGLCVLLAESPKKDDEKDVIPCIAENNVVSSIDYEFTALVHGAVPSEWDEGIFMKVPTNGLRRWNNKQHSSELETKMDNLNDNFRAETSGTPKSDGDWIFLSCTQRLHNENSHDHDTRVNLSTLTIQSNFDSGRLSNLICFLLRKSGYPVVNDRFCKRELATLPRIMRNIVKNKLCIGCYKVELTTNKHIQDSNDNTSEIISVEPHYRTQCSYWRQTLLLARRKQDVERKSEQV
jgi:hypothetical protein